MEATPKLFGLVKTALIEEFDRGYVAVMQVANVIATTVATVAGSQEGGEIQYHEFGYMKPLKFKGDGDPIIAL